MILRSYPIRASLRCLVKNLWSMEHWHQHEDPCVQHMVPTGCTDVVFYMGDRGICGLPDDDWKQQPRGVVGGQQTRRFDLLMGRQVHFFVTTLVPGAARTMLGMPADELANCHVAVEDVYGPAGTELVGRLMDSPDDAARAHLIYDFFEQQVRARRRGLDPRVMAGVDRISRRGGVVRIASLARQLELSKRQLERLFAAEVGISPKRFARTIRFQHILAMKERDEKRSMADLAYGAGYADQAHFNRDFRQLTGRTPVDYFRCEDARSEYYSCI